MVRGHKPRLVAMQPAKRPAKTGFIITRAKVELNFMPTPFLDGLRRTCG